MKVIGRQKSYFNFTETTYKGQNLSASYLSFLNRHFLLLSQTLFTNSPGTWGAVYGLTIKLFRDTARILIIIEKRTST